MSIRTEINRITAAKTAIATAIAGKGVDVPNGTQIDGMAPLIDGISSGGIALDVMTASALPAAVTDGQIVVITDTTPGTVYIDTDEPASPATGDVWVKLEAEATVKLELTEESPYLRGGLTAAAQWDGSAWVSRDGYLGVDGAWEQIALSLPPIGTALNDMSWEDIAKVAASGKGAEYFSVGDRKAVEIDGSILTATIKGTYYCTIIGINHNEAHEGKGIHFQFAWDVLTGGTAYAFDNTYSGNAPYYMNAEATNTGGWASSDMRNIICTAFLACLPEELQAVIKQCKKYTDNVGQGGAAAEAVTATFDSIFLLSQYEAFGANGTANVTEAEYQEQYAYYAAGNSLVKNRASAKSNIGRWWLRSTARSISTAFRCVDTDGTGTTASANKSYGVAPAFCV